MARPTAPDHDDKAAAVLAAAGQVFAQRGYEGATMLDVAQAAGFSKAAGALGHPVSPRAAAYLVLGAANWTYYWYDPDGDLSIEDLARGAASVFAGAPVKT